MRFRRNPSPVWPGRVGTLAGVVALLAVAGCLAAWFHVGGPDRAGRSSAVALAAAACLPGSLIGWILTQRPPTPPSMAVASSLAAVALRIMPPLAVLAWVSSVPAVQSGTDAGPILVVFYLALLATDILLHIVLGAAASRRLRPPD